MDGLVKFSDYDIFGYLASGIVGLWVCDAMFGTQIVTIESWTVTHGAFAIIAAYVLGHGIAASATLILDRLLVRECLGNPTGILLADHSASRSRKGGKAFNWRKWVLSGYLEPLPSAVQQRVLERAKIAPDDQDKGEKAFYRAWPIIKRDPMPYARMESFLRLYGFCRNFSFISLAAAIAFYFRPPVIPTLQQGSLFPATCALLSAVVMFHRYLKFFRAYSAEVFTTYAEPEEAKGRRHE